MRAAVVLLVAGGAAACADVEPTRREGAVGWLEGFDAVEPAQAFMDFDPDSGVAALVVDVFGPGHDGGCAAAGSAEASCVGLAQRASASRGGGDPGARSSPSGLPALRLTSADLEGGEDELSFVMSGVRQACVDGVLVDAEVSGLLVRLGSQGGSKLLAFGATEEDLDALAYREGVGAVTAQERAELHLRGQVTPVDCGGP